MAKLYINRMTSILVAYLRDAFGGRRNLDSLIGKNGLYIEKGTAMYAEVMDVTRPYKGKSNDSGLLELSLCERPHADYNGLEGLDIAARQLPVASTEWILGKGSVSTRGYISSTFIYGADLLADIASEVRQRGLIEEHAIYCVAREKMRRRAF